MYHFDESIILLKYEYFHYGFLLCRCPGKRVNFLIAFIAGIGSIKKEKDIISIICR